MPPRQRTPLTDPSLEAALARLSAAARRLQADTLAALEESLAGASSPADAFARADALLTDYTLATADLLCQAGLAGALLGAEGVGSRIPAVPLLNPEDAARLSPRLDALAQSYERLPAAYREPYLRALSPDDAAALGPLVPTPDVPVRELLGLSAEESGVRLPVIERAAEALAQKRLVSYDEMRQMAAEARAGALRVAGVQKREALGRLHEILVEGVREGTTLQAFRERVADQLPEGTFLSPASVETTFRDALQQAYSEGMDRVLSDPLAGDLFPYEETVPIRDSRLSSMCQLAARSGIGGTAIFRRDDPVWQRIKPPRHPRCRCGRLQLTLEDAAGAGIAEAAAWLRTGRPPAVPSFVAMPVELAREGL